MTYNIAIKDEQDNEHYLEGLESEYIKWTYEQKDAIVITDNTQGIAKDHAENIIKAFPMSKAYLKEI